MGIGKLESLREKRHLEVGEEVGKLQGGRELD